MDFDGLNRDIGEKGLARSLLTLPATGGKFKMNNKQYLNFSSNDYLDLANDPAVKKAAASALKKYGAGSGGSRLMTGTLPVHEELEKKLASWIGTDAALVFGSGFLANIGVISALVKKGDTVFFDRLNHASLIDGVMLSGAAWKRYRHNDPADLDKLLKECGTGGKFVITDSVFSMDGDICSLEEISAITKKHNAFLIVDEAHAIGIYGKGAGVCAQRKIKPDMITGTLSKALGGYGGFAACALNAKQYMVSSSRSFIFSTALPPASAAAGAKAIDIIRKDPAKGEQLLENAKYFHGILKKAGMNLPAFESQIIPVIIGDNDKALTMASLLMAEGLFIRAIRPPTVPQGTARLRISITLAHTKPDLKKAAAIIIKAAKKEGLL